MSVQLENYTPSLHNVLLDFMQIVYPYRNKQYLDWWLTNIDQSGSACWEKCILIVDEGTVIGCTTVNKAVLCADESRKEYFFRGNTIISPSQRGKGISKLIYNDVNKYDNWISVGVTDIAWKIQPKYVKNFTPIRPIFVYISVNGRVVMQFFHKLLRNKSHSCHFPEFLLINRHDSLKRVADISQMEIPQNGLWTSDSIEFVRDSTFLQKRFFDIYCSKRYAMYQYLSDGKCLGYVVLRTIRYKGIDMVSLVDYRFFSRDDEYKAFKAASRFARSLGIGLVLTLSSRKYRLCLSPLTIMMRKKLNCAIGMKQYVEQFNDILFTSADSDLDFVYYK